MRDLRINLNGSFDAILSLDPTQAQTPDLFVPLATIDALAEWVVVIDNGPRFATRYTYSTQYASDKKMEFQCGNPRAAIQQAAIYATRGELIKNLFVRILPVEESTGS